MKKRDYFVRYVAVAGFFVAVILIFIARLVTVQIAGPDRYTESASSKTYTRYETIKAQRGEIFDRNGNLLVKNLYSYDLYLDGGSFPTSNADKNSLILKLLDTAAENNEYDGFTLPSDPFEASGETWTLNGEFMQTVYGKRLSRLMTELEFSQDKDGGWSETDIGEVRDVFMLRYGLADKEGKLLYEESQVQLLFALRLDMELKNFSSTEPYTLICDVALPFINAVMEGGHRGYNINCRAERGYMYPGYASHILGRVGKIRAEEAQYYTDKGYSLNAIVGTSGAEQAFEEYLCGTDGVMAVVEDKYGNVVEKYVKKEPVAGKNVYLTIDIQLQIDAEEALKNNINQIVEKAVQSGEPLSGEDADSGALSAISSKTGEVLALASYPTYNLATFNEDYETLRTDPASPLFNRALEGTYPPGSTFKVGVALAALQEGIITPYTEIQDKGEYDYYKDSGFAPKCWIYSPRYGYQTHGYVNVSEAIQVSCNCFFYDVGRRLTITNMNRYCTAFGLGQPTGIELSEKTGVLAGPAEREQKGETWYDGDTLQAAIGQSDNLFTPLQISNYISTFLNMGQRKKAHLLYQVKDYSGNLLYEFAPVTVDSVELSPRNYTTVKNAMRNVTENGSAARVFVNYPIEVGGKTGTAQVSDKSSDNAIFTAFAPFADPEIVVSCIIEHGSNGTDAGFAVRDVFSSYFKIGTGDNADDNG